MLQQCNRLPQQPFSHATLLSQQDSATTLLPTICPKTCKCKEASSSTQSLVCSCLFMYNNNTNGMINIVDRTLESKPRSAVLCVSQKGMTDSSKEIPDMIEMVSLMVSLIYPTQPKMVSFIDWSFTKCHLSMVKPPKP